MFAICAILAALVIILAMLKLSSPSPYRLRGLRCSRLRAYHHHMSIIFASIVAPAGLDVLTVLIVARA
eukprot:3245327-Lingulodinium_polyedra.AAC.1